MQTGAAFAQEPSKNHGTISWQRAWLLHLWSFLLPSVSLAFFVTGPHPWWMALAAIGFIATLVLADNLAPSDLRQPEEAMPDWLFDIQCYALTILQLANHIALGWMASQLSYGSIDELIVTVANLVGALALGGVTAGYTGIVLAHEWVHRRSHFQRFLGRLLLMFVWYEHFATEHVRGHHPRLGTPADPATARFGEGFREFLFRTQIAQFKSAWRLENKRIGRTGGFSLRHRGLQGVLAQIAITAGYFLVFGPVALVFFLLQCRSAQSLLEVVNYIEHWGIRRANPKRVTPVDSWDTENWFTLHTLIGLSRHADHHAQASRPYQKLRHFDETPKMPRGYYGTIIMALLNNEKYQAEATAELKRRGLGPFRKTAELEAAAAAE